MYTLKKRLTTLLIVGLSVLLAGSFSSCSKKTGCPMNDSKQIHAKTNKKGEFSTKRGKTQLFPTQKKRKKSK